MKALNFYRGCLAGGLALCAGCAAGDTGPWAGSVSDSAGVTFVSNPAEGIWTDADRWTVERDLVIGATEGDPNYLFGRIAGICVDSRRRIYVLDAMAWRFTVYDPNGVFLHSFGESGSGPGELGMFVGPCFVVPGDTIVVPDRSNGRLNRFGPDGSFLSSVRIRVDAHEGLPIHWQMTGDGRLAQQDQSSEPSRGPEWNGVLLHGRDGVVIDTVLEYRAGGTVRVSDLGKAILTVFAAEPDWTVTAEGNIWFGRGDDYRLEVRDSLRNLQRIVTNAFERQEVSEADRQVIRDLVRVMFRDRGVPDAVARQALTLEFAEVYPAYHRIRSGTRDHIWVQHTVRPTNWTPEEREGLSVHFLDWVGMELDTRLPLGAPDWDVFDPDGRFLGVVSMPSRFEPMAFVGDEIYGVWKNELDVEHVMRLKVVIPQ